VAETSTSRRLASYLPNPKYGEGILRRRITFAADGQSMVVTLFDSFHDMLMRIDHDGERITAIQAEMSRYPKTTCPGAVAMLDQLLGCEIAQGRNAVVGRFSRFPHCTHLFDLVTWGISALQRGVTEQCVELSLTDRDNDERQQLDLSVDGTLALQLLLENEKILEPRIYASRSLFGGFTAWADAEFEGLERDLWQMAQMAVFISHGLAYIVDGPEQQPASLEPSRKGACFSYSDPSFAVARNMVGYVQDLTAGLPDRDPARDRFGKGPT
jgi:hypothetical protein